MSVAGIRVIVDVLLRARENDHAPVPVPVRARERTCARECARARRIKLSALRRNTRLARRQHRRTVHSLDRRNTSISTAAHR